MYASKICSYAQGFALMREASSEYNWDLDLGTIALGWRGGCIIRARFLHRIADAYENDPDLPNLLLDPYFLEVIERTQDNWRQVVATAMQLGIPIPPVARRWLISIATAVLVCLPTSSKHNGITLAHTPTTGSMPMARQLWEQMESRPFSIRSGWWKGDQKSSLIRMRFTEL